MPHSKVILGSNVYVPSPKRYISECASITGDVVRIVNRGGKRWATVEAYVAKIGGGYPISFSLPYYDLAVRIGTPISQLSGRPGYPGYARFKSIAASWGHQ